jgi:hypothetical protein
MPAAGAWLAAGFAGAGGVGAGIAASAILSIGTSLVIGKLSRPKGGGRTGSELQLSGDPVGVRELCYGEAWTAGTLRYRNAAGTDNRDFYMVIVLAGHEIDSVTAVEADRNTLTLDGSGNVTAPSQYVGLLNVRFVSGTDGQSVDSTLDSAFANWTADHRLRGCAYAIVKCTFDETNMPQPPAFRFKVKGRKVYDPRLDSTNGGSGAHRLATPSTWEWSRNPVLQANDFLRGVSVNSIYVAGLGLASTRFDWANVIAEANICDENVSLAAGGTEDRYTGDGFIDPRQTPEEILRHFEMAIAGEIIPSDGKWRFFAGAYRTPTLALTDEHFVGPLRHVVHKGELDRVDTATGRYSSFADSGTPVNYSPVRLSTATTGSERAVEYDFQLVADTTNTGGVYDGGARAQRIAKLLLEKEEAGKQIICQTSLYGLRAVPGETITITHSAFGLSAQAMRVMEVQLRPVPTDGGVALVVDLVLEAGPSSLYSWSAAETAIGAAPTLPQLVVPAPLNGHAFVPDTDGRPAALRQGYSAASTPDRANLTIASGAVHIAATTSEGVDFCLPAIPVDDTKTYQLTVRHYGTVASADGRYFRFHEYSSATLPDGITHISDDSAFAEPMFVTQTSFQDAASNVALSTTAATDTFDYTPTSGTKLMSLGFFNYLPATTTHLVIEWVAFTRDSGVDLLPFFGNPASTQDINHEAATEVAEATDSSVVATASNSVAEELACTITWPDVVATDVFELVATGVMTVTASGAGSPEAYVRFTYDIGAGNVVAGIALNRPIPAAETPFANTVLLTGLATSSMDVSVLVVAAESGGGTVTNTVTALTFTITKVKR